MGIRYRQIKNNELPGLIELYKYLHVNDAALPDEMVVGKVWHAITTDDKIHCLVADVNGKLVASCVLVIVPNLTRGARPFALIENVVTHADYRRQGIGTRLLEHAKSIARRNHCYKVMLMTGRQLEETLRFYENAGFRRGGKTGFVTYFE